MTTEFFYVPLDVNYPENHKRLRAGLAATGLHTLCMCLAKRSKRDGWVSLHTLSIYGATDELIDTLVSFDLLDIEGEWVRPHDWLEVNLSSDRIRTEKADKARAANHARWHDGPFDACDVCNQKRRSSEPDPDGLHTESSRIPTGPSEVKRSDTDSEQRTTDADGRKALLQAAANIIGGRAAARSTTLNPEVTRRSVAAAVMEKRYQDGYAFIAANPAITPDELAEALEPTRPTKVEPANPSSHIPHVADLDLPPLSDEERRHYQFIVIEGQAS